MFGSKKNNQFPSGGHTLFDRAVEIRGDVIFGGTLDVEGKVIGDIVAVEGADAVIRVRDKGAVEGEIKAPQVVINGRVTGDVYATKHLELAANAVVHGNVHYSVIEMVKGAEVNGNLIHISENTQKKSKVEALNADIKVSNRASEGSK
ncbi:bactofilin family protein [Agarilytica rhodophyticola]|uniref:bactofilin family protein n=1 Tax=Agarilytica rhodophyticola TaxID=1737490 RepID=UPI000B349E84|nr:polymer-forming cytoskeletal protein [Agarilytica rhodophyticola]